jgi:hypothetical protein
MMQFQRLALLGLLTGSTVAYNAQPVSRRDFGLLSASGIAALQAQAVASQPAFAFDGSGSSASSGKNPATKAEMKKSYQKRIVADVRDFNSLGQAIANGELEGKEWVNFFVPFQRREPDPVGRTYAALVDLRGVPTKKRDEYEGGDGFLLANTFTKAGKPPDNTPAVRSFNKLSKTFDPIEAAGKKGDAAKAKAEFEKAKTLFSQYLADVELASDLNNPIYN